MEYRFRTLEDYLTKSKGSTGNSRPKLVKPAGLPSGSSSFSFSSSSSKFQQQIEEEEENEDDALTAK
jgi:hypothetical protein